MSRSFQNQSKTNSPRPVFVSNKPVQFRNTNHTIIIKMKLRKNTSETVLEVLNVAPISSSKLTSLS